MARPDVGLIVDVAFYVTAVVFVVIALVVNGDSNVGTWLRDRDYLRYDGFRVIANSAGQIEAVVPLKPHPPLPGRSPGLRKGWWMLLRMGLDALLRRPPPKL